MTILIIKLLLTPLFIALVTLAGRRWGPAASGLLVGLPLTSGPVSFFLAIEQDANFASQAATGTLIGLAAVALYCLAYSLIARRGSWLPSIVGALATLLLTMLVLSIWQYTLFQAFVLTVTFLGISFLLIPNVKGASSQATPTKWDIPLRMAVATATVLALTEAAHLLGPQLSGLLSPVPVFSSILAVFSHRIEGAHSAILVLKGTVLGLSAFAVFFLIVGSLISHQGIVLTYILATLAALVVNGVAYLIVQRRKTLRSHN